jgi:hypothetical protein
VLTVTVTPFEPLPKKVLDAIEAEAGILAAVRGVPAAAVVFE